jgi:hypothetical protein
MPKHDEKLKGMEVLGPDACLAHMLGYNQYDILNAATPTPAAIENSRILKVDIDGWAKITYEDNYGNSVSETTYLIGGAQYNYRNVSKWETCEVTIEGEVQTLAQVANSSGVLSDGVKIYR